MDVALSLVSDDLSAEDIQYITFDLCKTINRETEAEATFAEQANDIGAKGDPITIGTLALNFLTGGAAVALFSVLRAYFERSSSLEMELQRKDGEIFKLKATNLDPHKIDQTIQSVQSFLGDST